MSVRSILSLGLLASSALAGPAGYGSTTTKTKTVTETKTKTAKASTVTKTAKASTVTKTATVTKSASCSFSTSHSTSFSTSTSTTKASSPISSSTSTSVASPSTTSTSVPVTTTTTTTATTPTTTLTATATATGYGLNDAAKAAGKLFFGTAADVPGTGEAADPYWAAQYNNTHDFGEATPANIMKWQFTEPEQGVFDFTGAEQFLAASPGKLIRCHNLVWQSELAPWVTSTNWTNATLTAAMGNHITTLIEYFGDRCYSWDVVNEAFSDSVPVTNQPSPFATYIGPAYVALAFQFASAAVKKNNLAVQLYYNDYNIESPNAKSNATQALVAQLKAEGTQIDGVGLESHFIGGSTPSLAAQKTQMASYVALGVDVVVTELDVRIPVPPTAAMQAQQKLDYYNTVAACTQTKGCVGIVVWDFDDTYSWIPGVFAGTGYADLFFQPGGANTPLVKKDLYDGCLEALTGVAEVSPL